MIKIFLNLNFCKIFFLYLMILLFCSCDEKSLIFNPNNSYDYEFQTFKINSESSFSLRNSDFNSGLSPYLYSGIVNDSIKSYSVIKIESDIVYQNSFCSDSSIISINDIKLRLMTQDLNDENLRINGLSNLNFSNFDNETNPVQNSFLVNDYIKAYYLDESDFNDFEENSAENHSQQNFANIENLLNDDKLLNLDFFHNESPYNVSSVYVNLSDIYDNDSNQLKDIICNYDTPLYIVLDYTPVSQESLVQNIEFYSGDYINIFLNPAIFIDYESSTLDIEKINKFSISDINSNILESSDYLFNTDEKSEKFGTVLSFKIPNSNFDLSDMDSLIQFDDNLYIEPILNSSNDVVNLFQIDIELNEAYKDSFSDIRLFFNDVYFGFNDLDPSRDNWTQLDTSGTEGNQVYDLGEKFNDLGFDNCPNQYETSYYSFNCDSINNSSNYNPNGTEGNSLLDWIDSGDLNEIWDEGEGEAWYDFGEDNCENNYELGGGLCLSQNAQSNNINIQFLCDSDTNIDSLSLIYDEISSFNIDLCSNSYYDFNNDNQNRDPANDDYSCIEWNSDFSLCLDNNGKLEDNGVYDLGEPFLDYGIDQIPDSLEQYSNNITDDNWTNFNLNGTENNGQYDYGEIFFDTGLDSLFSYQEVGYNFYGKENNKNFDLTYEVFDDYGIDNIENGYLGDEDDNYVLDPNNDDIFENNGVLDFDDSGIDRCMDNYELGNGNCLSDNAIYGNVNIALICNTQTNLDSLIILYGQEISSFDLDLCDSGSDFNSDNWSEDNQNGTEGNSLWDWFDQDGDGVFSYENDAYELTEIWYDYGLDGKIDSLENNYGNNSALNTIESNLFNLDFSEFDFIGDSILFDSLIIDQIDNRDISMWISKIKKIDENKFRLNIELMNLVDVIGMQFQLDHEYFYEIIDSTQTQSRSFYPYKFNDLNNNLFPDQDELIENSSKYIQDYSLYNLVDFVEDSLLLSGYNGLNLNLDFNNLSNFLQDNQNSIIASDQTKLILYIQNQNNYDNNLDIYYEVFNESDNEFVVFEDIQPYRVSENADSIQLEIGPLIQKYLYNELIFNSENNQGIRLKIGNYSNNLSEISFIKNDSIKSPRLEVLFKNEN